MWRLVAIGLAAGCLAACGDGGPSGSSQTSTITTTAPASVTLLVVSGETGAPVPGATVIVGGVSLTSDGSGNVDAGTVRAGATIDVLAASYFDRQTLYRGQNDTRLALWPMTSPTGLTQEITQRLVYTGFGEDAIRGEIPLRRPPLDEPIQVYVEPDIAGDSRVVAVVEDALGAMRSALEDRVEFLVTPSRPSDGVVWRITTDPDVTSSEFIAQTRLFYNGSEIVGADLGFRTPPDLYEDARLLINMMGAAFGLTDSTDVNDRMYYDWWRRRPSDFSPKEALLMRLMLQRRAGNRWPDNDRGLGTSGLLEVSSEGYVRAPR